MIGQKWWYCDIAGCIFDVFLFAAGSCEISSGKWLCMTPRNAMTFYTSCSSSDISPDFSPPNINQPVCSLLYVSMDTIWEFVSGDEAEKQLLDIRYKNVGSDFTN